MKHLILTAVLVSGLTFLAGSSASAQQDSVKTKKITYGKSISIGPFVVKSGNGDTIQRRDPNKARFVGGLTFTRLDIGFSKLIDNGSFSLSPANKFLDYNAWKTSHLSFDVLQMGYRFNSNFKIYVAGGFDWTLIRLKENITMQKNTADLTYINEPIIFSKNRFSSSYLHIPLNFELRTKENNKGRRWYFVVGPEVGFLLNGKVKQISDERGKEKFKDDYNFAPFRYGGTVRVGTNGLALFAKYYANDMFDSTPQKGLKNMAFGLTFGIN
ncbi:outer membrane beta-barrel protein [Pedobacter boryungensis]|uniref:Outer membrane beta-barrel protein n=1 Tax=Pedobacter boryungensis TaxID=869962 RepID=A0ABX2D7V7_9SPHI|nr:outer membrane beta-barrel protein [Pedobacter boryungensis]NQX30137.1 outer membrane beta-barrel protein [Pedobacter boryungensis]